ncbi:uncharacterized protein [Elaeis guineensis]|uniref:uncharacterized protein isoform X2 n=1 Tax=Elaeis guineensis var. tenera TaxID=51953 RepID=UPI003C6D7DE2
MVLRYFPPSRFLKPPHFLSFEKEGSDGHGVGCHGTAGPQRAHPRPSPGLARALHMAAANGHLDIVEYLINNGVDVNAANSEKNTPLHWACLNGHIEVIKTLIHRGASVSVLNSHERTPMDEAVSGGKMEVVDAINAAVAQAELNGVSVS